MEIKQLLPGKLLDLRHTEAFTRLVFEVDTADQVATPGNVREVHIGNRGNDVKMFRFGKERQKIKNANHVRPVGQVMQVNSSTRPEGSKYRCEKWSDEVSSGFCFGVPRKPRHVKQGIAKHDGKDENEDDDPFRRKRETLGSSNQPPIQGIRCG